MSLIKYFPKATAVLLAFVFLYATVSKFFELKKFYYQLGKSPLIPYDWNENIGKSILVIELIVVYLVYKNKIKHSLLLSFTLMFFFSLYIGYLLYFSYYIPCSCGGILGDLSWENHLVFNLSLTTISGLAYLIVNE